MFEDAQLSVGIFVLPRGTSIPLHDHPNMTVLSKLLFGSIAVTSFDMPPGGATPSRRGLFAQRERTLRCGEARRRTATAPCEALRLDPHAGNIHEFVALETTAIFDVLTPPYDSFAGRSCHYYSVRKEEAGEGGGGWVELAETGWPSSLRIVSRPYTGQPCGPGE